MAKFFKTTINKMTIENDPDIIGDAFIVDQKNDLKSKLGTIFGIIELSNLPDQINDRIIDILNDLKTEYYLPPFETDYGIEKRFEESLQRANRRLYKMINEYSDKIALNNINILLALIRVDRIYLSRIGQAHAFLFHFKKKHEHLIVDIFEQAGEKRNKANPEKMFSNIISGVISDKDQLFFTNDTILEFLSISQIMQISVENNSHDSVKLIKQILEEESEINNFYSLSLQPDLPEKIEQNTTNNQTINTANSNSTIPPRKMPSMPSQHSIDHLLHTQTDTEKYLNPSAMPGWKKLLLYCWSNLIKVTKLSFYYSKAYGAKAIKKSKLTITRAVTNKQLHQKNNQETTEILENDQTSHKIDTQISNEQLPDDQNYSQDTEKASVKKITEISSELATSIGNNYQRLKSAKHGKSWSQLISIWLNNQIAKFVNLKRWQQTFLIAGFILIFLFSQSLVWQGRSGYLSGQGDIDQIINQIEEHINTAEAQNIFNDEEGANKSMAEASELLAQIPDNRTYRDIKIKWESRLQDLRQSLQKLTYLDSPVITANLINQNETTNPSGLALTGNGLFVFDNDNQKLYQIDLANAQTNSFDLIINNEVSKIKTYTDQELIAITRDNKTFYKINLNQKSAEKILETEKNNDDFGLYGNNLYTLRTADNQVYKHVLTGSGFNSGSGWITDGTEIIAGQTIAIDGGIYISQKDGQITYFMAGQKEKQFQLDLQPKLSLTVQAYSNINSNYFYLLDPDNQRVVVADKNGNLKIQYTSKEFSNLKAMAIDEQNKKIYLLAGQKIYQIDINF